MTKFGLRIYIYILSQGQIVFIKHELQRPGAFLMFDFLYTAYIPSEFYGPFQDMNYLERPTPEKIIHATKIPCLDYCNSLLYGAKQSHINRLQCCQNNAPRIISKRVKFDHISPVLRKLHWLPVEHRISYKILLLAYKALTGHAPQYLAGSISKYVSPRPLRSEDQYLLNPPRW